MARPDKAVFFMTRILVTAAAGCNRHKLVWFAAPGHFRFEPAVAAVDNPFMPELLQLLAAELERPRAITAQVFKHLADAHGIYREDAGHFLVTKLKELDDYEVDLILSPLFTPTLRDQSVVAAALGRESFPVSRWPLLVLELAARPIIAKLIGDADALHPVPLRDVTIERYVNRLRLDATIPSPTSDLIQNRRPVSDAPLLLAIARRAIWNSAGRIAILDRALSADVSVVAVADIAALLKLMETYEPADSQELLALIPHWQQVLRQEINSAGSKPFFNERVQDLHGGGRDQRKQSNTRITALESESALLGRLQQLFART